METFDLLDGRQKEAAKQILHLLQTEGFEIGSAKDVLTGCAEYIDQFSKLNIAFKN